MAGNNLLPKGFIVNGIHCGIKKNGKEDLALFYCPDGGLAAGVFTMNLFKSASIIISKRNLNNKIYAILANSGCANAVTGEEGVRDAEEVCRYLSEKIQKKPQNILVASTGPIGKKLPLEKIKSGIDRLPLNVSDPIKTAKAITTTDKTLKIETTKFRINDSEITVWACAKGSGMIFPNLATMLVFILTDVNISKKLLNISLKMAIENSFNNISVDGDTSTNDSIFMISSLKAGNSRISKIDNDFEKFYRKIEIVCKNLSRKIVLDAEGATKFLEIQVVNAKNKKIAKEVAQKVANSLLVKTAFYGEDPNFGRIVSACGNAKFLRSSLRAKKGFDPDKMEVYINGVVVLKNNRLLNCKKELLKPKKIKIEINLNTGKEKIEYYTCDISEEFIRLNSQYTT